MSRVVLNDLAPDGTSADGDAQGGGAEDESFSPAEIAHGALRGTIAAMAMTGMREFTLHAGILEQTPPEAVFTGAGRFRRPRGSGRALVELAHWSYGAAGGAVYGALPESVRRTPWSGPAYGLIIWLSFELAIAPALSLPQAKRVRLVDRAALAVDHLLYGLVLSETRRLSQG